MTADGKLLAEVVKLAGVAGNEVMKVYGREYAVRDKSDGSPVTEADERAQELICAGLARLHPGIPIVAEEGQHERDRDAAPAFWLVDPLDGTKEFLSRNGEFTVNIALVEAGRPRLGVVLAPALSRLYAGCAGAEAVVLDVGGRRALAARRPPADGVTVVSSRSHGDREALERFLAGQEVASSVAAGSSLKFCLVAAGEADLYPRFGRTMEWDTGAGDAVLRAAGGSVTDLSGAPLVYGKAGFENPPFVARGRSPSSGGRG